jgi:hypothetical protein
LILNAVQAMSGVTERTRELLISTQQEASGAVLVTVQDSGPGFSPESFDPLHHQSRGHGYLALDLPVILVYLLKYTPRRLHTRVDARGRIWASLAAGVAAVAQFSL